MSGPAPVLVTGALGFVGRWLIAELLAAGQQVVGAGRLEPGTEFPHQLGTFTRHDRVSAPDGQVSYAGPAGSWTFVRCDLEEPAAVDALLDRHAPAAVVHLAAQSSAGHSFADPHGTFTDNLSACLNLLEAIRIHFAAQPPILLAVGSCEEYGPQGKDQVPLTERTALNPVSPYGVSKVAQSLLCMQYQRSYDLPIMVARAFSHTGPGHDERFAFSAFARQIVAAERGEIEPVISVGNLTPLRDYLDVRDVCRAYRLLLEEGAAGQIYNVSSGQALTMQEGLEILLREAQCPLEIRSDPVRWRPADISYMVGDNTKLTERTGWRPEHAIADTLRDLLIWTRKELA